MSRKVLVDVRLSREDLGFVWELVYPARLT